MLRMFEELGKIGIVPVIKIDDVAKALPLAKALADGGIPAAEITFRTAAGVEALRRISFAMPELILGAGTVLTTGQVDQAVDAGADFVVTPGFNPRIVAYCVAKGVPVIPGCSNPSDIEQALDVGIDLVKFFPAEQAGGLAYIKALAGPYPRLQFMPTGGINQKNLTEYLGFDRVLACGGSWMVTPELIDAGDFVRITGLCRDAMRTMLGFHLAHLGINAVHAKEAVELALLFEALFGFGLQEGNSSIFSSDQIEIMKIPGLGTCGHIGIGTRDLKRAIAALERKDIAFNRESAKTDAQGNLAAIYLQREIAGFAVHLVQKSL
ncbi:MAG: bifunctional 4-hydroxy-2-oxoglutarate aldolase/2-dehydro-3-deoxy-phosphogluconate aldolase [Treponema sp.]|jgi:2-dehydro-3-deoxyphosphogluconate aldolase/(4S)-4-hydroxy-2-oxoglutarate aldolase|nr:bifunctional 4-hydroxy-2-oxoglutarate aldolase/2-dehydro-3-deoxy-phosphogluconate aldolase [Treponema sp.]